jgi:hypothetical protein
MCVLCDLLVMLFRSFLFFFIFYFFIFSLEEKKGGPFIYLINQMLATVWVCGCVGGGVECECFVCVIVSNRGRMYGF